MEKNKELTGVNSIRKNVPVCCHERERGIFRKATGPSRDLEISAEERLIDRDHEEFECKFPDYLRSSYLMVFSADRKLIASTHGNRNVYVNDLTTGKHIKTLTGHPRTPWCIAFHPSTNQILASGCLGGQVRVWDLHGGSEIWTAKGETVIASLAFHPTDHVLVIATYNEIHFWDWSKEKPFAKCNTSDDREKVRYVSFDRYGHKLITGIGNVLRLPSQWDQQVADRDGTVNFYHEFVQDRLVGRLLLANRNAGSSLPRRSNQQPRQTMDRGTDPMEFNENPLSGTTRCSVCRRDTNADSSSRPSTSAEGSATSTTTTQTAPTSSNSIGVSASIASSSSSLPDASQSSTSQSSSIYIGPTISMSPSSLPGSPSAPSTSISSPSSSSTSSSSSSNTSDPPITFTSRTSPFRSASSSTEERRRHSAGTDEISASHSSSRFLSPPNLRSTSLSNLLRNLSEFQRSSEGRSSLEPGSWSTLNHTLALRRQESRRIMEELSSEWFSTRNRDTLSSEDQNPDLPPEPSSSLHDLSSNDPPLFNENRPSAFRPASSSVQPPQNDEFAYVQEGIELVNQHIENIERRADIDEGQLNRIRWLWDLLQSQIRTLQREVREMNSDSGDSNNNSNPSPGTSGTNETSNATEDHNLREQLYRDISRARTPPVDSLTNVTICGCNVCSTPSLRSRSIQFLRNLVDQSGHGNNLASRVIRVRISPVSPGRSTSSQNEPSTSSSSGRNGFPRRRLCPFSRCSAPTPKRPRVDSPPQRNSDSSTCNRCHKAIPPRPGRKTDHRQNAQNTDSPRPSTSSQSRSPSSSSSRSHSPVIFFKTNRHGSTSSRSSNGASTSRCNNAGNSGSASGLTLGANNPENCGSVSGFTVSSSSSPRFSTITFNRCNRNVTLSGPPRQDVETNSNSNRPGSSSSGNSGNSSTPDPRQPFLDWLSRSELTIQSSIASSLNRLRNQTSAESRRSEFQRSSLNSRRNFFSCYHDAVRTRARYVLPTMVRGLTQFFEYDTSASQGEASNETYHQRIGSLTHLLYLALNLSTSLLAQLDRSRRERLQELRWSGLTEFHSVRRNPPSSFAPPHRIQAWDFTKFSLPDISNADKNLVVGECKIHNDASVDVSRDGELLVTLMSTHRFNVATMLGVYSLNWKTLGQCLYTTVFDQSAVSVSLSPTSKHLIVGFASRRTISFFQSEKQKIAKIYKLEESGNKFLPDDPKKTKGNLSLVKELKMSREPSDLVSLNCIRWAPTAGEGFVYATNVGKVKILR